MNTSEREQLARRMGELLLEFVEGIAKGTGVRSAPAKASLAPLTTVEVAALTRRTPDTIRRWAKTGRLERLAGAGRALYTPAAVDAAIRGGGPRGAKDTPAARAERKLRAVR